jgi:ABC-type nitrate/sulfonate/bicarbonate transport system substrate-binding protein
MWPWLSFRTVGSLIALGIWLLQASNLMALDRVIIGNVSRTMEQLPNYAASDKGFFTQEGIQGDVVLIG